MITPDNFFEQEIILEDDRARLEPLTEKHFEALMAIALQQQRYLEIYPCQYHG